MSTSASAHERELSRQSRGLRKPGTRFALLSLMLEVPGILLFVLGEKAVRVVGIALIGLGLAPSLIAGGMLLAALVTGWAAGRRPFA